MRPKILSFDVFGTVVDWRRGLLAALGRQGVMLPEAAFDDVIDAQAAAESGPYATYAEITARSLETEIGLAPEAASEIAAAIGDWPVYADSPAALRRLLGMASCVAMTNSDRAHREPIQRQLGAPLSAWVCAEDLRLYKPDPRFWHRTSEVLEEPFSSAWWHVSGYADYDLDVARRLGLTTVFVARPHARPGAADHHVSDLAGLADLVASIPA
jgi:2-haloalkanoic acid dehalogenase type II